MSSSIELVPLNESMNESADAADTTTELTSKFTVTKPNVRFDLDEVRKEPSSDSTVPTSNKKHGRFLIETHKSNDLSSTTNTASATSSTHTTRNPLMNLFHNYNHHNTIRFDVKVIRCHRRSKYPPMRCSSM